MASSSVNGIGRQSSGSRWTQSETASTSLSGCPSRAIEVRRSAHIRPRPLQNVASVQTSPKRGKRSARIRVRRTTHTAVWAIPASTTSP